jgi:hypothetical protein
MPKKRPAKKTGKKIGNNCSKVDKADKASV